MGLVNSNEQMWDMPLNGTSAATKKHVTHWFGNVGYVIVAAVCKLLFRYHVDGRENIRGFKGKSGVLIVCNHTSYLDVVFMYLAIRPYQWMRIMGREPLFKYAGGILGQILSRTGAFPIKRDSADRTAVKRAVRMLKDKEIVGILPEGTRRNKGNKIPSVHSGAALIARMAHVPILPMTVRDCERVKQKGKFIRLPKITIEYGTPILVSDFDFLPKEERLDGCSWYAMRECFALSLRIPADQVDMPALFPDGKDYSAVFAEHPIPTHTTAEVCGDIDGNQTDASDAAVSSDAADITGTEKVPVTTDSQEQPVSQGGVK